MILNELKSHPKPSEKDSGRRILPQRAQRGRAATKLIRTHELMKTERGISRKTGLSACGGKHRNRFNVQYSNSISNIQVRTGPRRFIDFN
jgi:hypothetical protein